MNYFLQNHEYRFFFSLSFLLEPRSNPEPVLEDNGIIFTENWEQTTLNSLSSPTVVFGGMIPAPFNKKILFLV